MQTTGGSRLHPLCNPPMCGSLRQNLIITGAFLFNVLSRVTSIQAWSSRIYWVLKPGWPAIQFSLTIANHHTVDDFCKTQHLLSPAEWKHLLSAECCLSNAAIRQKIGQKNLQCFLSNLCKDSIVLHRINFTHWVTHGTENLPSTATGSSSITIEAFNA